MSQTPPIALELTAATQHHTYHGIADVRVLARSWTLAGANGKEALCAIKNVLIEEHT
jgi:hypothetical protein